MEKPTVFTLRCPDKLIKKLAFIARYNDRSTNLELTRLVKKHIREFETEHGAITAEDLD